MLSADELKERLTKARETIDEQLRKLDAGEITAEELEKASREASEQPNMNIACDSSCHD